MFDHILHSLKQPKYLLPLVILTVLGMIILVYLTSQIHEDKNEMPPESEMSHNASSIDENSSNKQDTPPISDIVVDVKGAVAHPKTYTMKSNQRVNDLLEKAGVLKHADLSQINLAEKLIDQKMIYIPSKDEKTSPHLTQGGTTTETGNDIQPVNLNLAETSDLTKIPGIGPSKAETILKYREEKGAFKSVDELKEINGIGEKTFEKLKPYFVV